MKKRMIRDIKIAFLSVFMGEAIAFWYIDGCCIALIIAIVLFLYIFIKEIKLLDYAKD